MKQTVCVIGEGAWGTAFATLLAHNGCEVNLWCHEPSRAEQIKKGRYNATYLPGIRLVPAIKPVTSFEEALCGVKLVFEAIPLQFIRQTLEMARGCYAPTQTWVVLSKGVEDTTLFLPSQIIADVFNAPVKTAVVAGPNFAMELAQQKITAATIGVADCPTGLEVQSLLTNEYFKPYISLDPIGVQVGGALKNVIALCVGMLDGAGYGDNAKAFVLTRGLREMVAVAMALGGRQETLYGLSGVGDLVLTAMGKASRNREVGYRLSKGEKLSTIMATAEGVNSVKAMHQLMERYHLELPLCAGLYQIIFNDLSLESWLSRLMQYRSEYEQACDV